MAGESHPNGDVDMLSVCEVERAIRSLRQPWQVFTDIEVVATATAWGCVGLQTSSTR